jgi:transposase
MAGETRRKFDRDFREGAVRLVRETGKPIAQVARDHRQLVRQATLALSFQAEPEIAGDGRYPLDRVTACD